MFLILMISCWAFSRVVRILQILYIPFIFIINFEIHIFLFPPTLSKHFFLYWTLPLWWFTHIYIPSEIGDCWNIVNLIPISAEGLQTDLNEFISLSKSVILRPVTSTVNYRRPTIYQIYSTNLISFLSNVFMWQCKTLRLFRMFPRLSGPSRFFIGTIRNR